MSVTNIAEKVQAKLGETNEWITKFEMELSSPSIKEGRRIQLQAYVTRLKHEKTFLEEISNDLQECESEQTINGDEQVSDEYSEDMGEVSEDEMGDEENEDEEDSTY